MKAAGKAYEPHVFDGAGHGFLRAQIGSERRQHARHGTGMAADAGVHPAEHEVRRMSFGRWALVVGAVICLAELKLGPTYFRCCPS